MKAQLQYGEYAPARGPAAGLHPRQLVQSQCQRLFTNHIEPRLQSRYGMGAMEVIRGADRQKFRTAGDHAPSEIIRIGGEIGAGEIPVDHPHAVEYIVRRHQIAPKRPHGVQMSRSYVPGNAYDRESPGFGRLYPCHTCNASLILPQK